MLSDKDRIGGMQYVIVSATLPRDFNSVLGDRFPVNVIV